MRPRYMTANDTCPSCFSCTAILRIPSDLSSPSTTKCADSWHDENYARHKAEFDADVAAAMRPTVMDLRGEPQPCEVCGNDASEYPCELGTFCDECHQDLNISGCRSDDCWGTDFDPDEL